MTTRIDEMQNKSVINSQIKTLIFDANTINIDDLSVLTKENATDQQIKDMLERLPFKLSAEGKLAIYNVLQFTVKVGDTLVRVGKKILEIVLMLVNRYPNATFGLVIASILTVLIALIPIVGPMLASFLGSLIAIFGLSVGFFKDLTDSNPMLVVDIKKASKIFSPLKQAV